MYVFAPSPDPSRSISLRGNARLDGIEVFFARMPHDHVAAGSAVMWQGESSESVVYVMSGVLRLCRLLPDGRRMITRFLYPGDILGLEAAGQQFGTAEAVTPVTVVRCSRTRFQNAMEASQPLREEVIGLLMRELRVANDHLLLLGRKTAEERVASFLLMIAERSADAGGGALGREPNEIVVPMSRQDIADYLGLTLETVCRAMTQFKRAKIITVWGRRQIWLRNRAALSSHACHMPAE